MLVEVLPAASLSSLTTYHSTPFQMSVGCWEEGGVVGWSEGGEMRRMRGERAGGGQCWDCAGGGNRRRGTRRGLDEVQEAYSCYILRRWGSGIRLERTVGGLGCLRGVERGERCCWRRARKGAQLQSRRGREQRCGGEREDGW